MSKNLLKKEIITLAHRQHALAKKEYVFFCSGGADSIASTHNAVKTLKLTTFKVYHFNHNIRKQNYEMEEAVRSLCSQYNWPLQVIKREETKLSSEDALRKWRINYINTHLNNSIIILGHHLNDCVESYLMNVFRGKENFLPIPFCTQIKSNTICRPYLFVEKNNLYSYNTIHNLTQFIVEDETNTITAGSRRNMIRNKIIPILNKEEVGLTTIVRKKMNERLNKLLLGNN